jgi:hypothetical protein
VPPKHFERLYAERHPPEGLAILVGYNDVGPVNKVWQFDHFGIELFLPPLLGERQGVARAGYAMTISIGRLLFQVVGVDRTDLFVPELFLDIVAWEPYVLRFWPGLSGITRWPPPQSFGNGQLEAFASRLGGPAGGWKSTWWAEPVNPGETGRLDNYCAGVTSTGLLIQAGPGKCGGTGAWRTKRNLPIYSIISDQQHQAASKLSQCT